MKTEIGDLVQNVQAGIILQQVNAQGVMGSGIAKQLREKYPIVWHDYTDRFGSCPSDIESRSRLGKFVISRVSENLLVVSIVGQQYYGRDGRARYTSYDALDIGLQNVANTISNIKDLQIHHPMIGAGLGGGCWNVIKEIIEHRLGADTTLWTLKDTK